MPFTFVPLPCTCVPCSASNSAVSLGVRPELRDGRILAYTQDLTRLISRSLGFDSGESLLLKLAGRAGTGGWDTRRLTAPSRTQIQFQPMSLPVCHHWLCARHRLRMTPFSCRKSPRCLLRIHAHFHGRGADPSRCHIPPPSRARWARRTVARAASPQLPPRNVFGPAFARPRVFCGRRTRIRAAAGHRGTGGGGRWLRLSRLSGT